MRRRLLWLLGSIVVLAGAFLAVIFLQNEERLTLDFLQGHPPLALPANLQKQYGEGYRCYTFEGNIWLLERTIRGELEAKGFTDVQPKRSASTILFVRLDPSAALGPMRPLEGQPVVRIDGHQRSYLTQYHGSPMLVDMEEFGWITVVISTPTSNPNILQRIRRWFGL